MSTVHQYCRWYGWTEQGATLYLSRRPQIQERPPGARAIAALMVRHRVRLEVEVPEVFKFYYSTFAQIDQHLRYRQDDLGLEKI